MIVWRVRGKIIRYVLCNIVCNNCALCDAHTLWTDLTVLWIGFCLTGPISLCLASFLHVLCVLLYKPVPNMTYNVFSGTLKPTQSIITHSVTENNDHHKYLHINCSRVSRLTQYTKCCKSLTTTSFRTITVHSEWHEYDSETVYVCIAPFLINYQNLTGRVW